MCRCRIQSVGATTATSGSGRRRRTAAARASASSFHGAAAQPVTHDVEAGPRGRDAMPAGHEQSVQPRRTADRARQQLVGPDQFDDVLVRETVIRL